MLVDDSMRVVPALGLRSRRCQHRSYAVRLLHSSELLGTSLRAASLGDDQRSESLSRCAHLGRDFRLRVASDVLR